MHTVVPVYMLGDVEYAKVEIQIRTIAMDFWASLEHKIRYKLDSDAPKTINDSLLECADLVHFLDEKMHQLNLDIEAYLKSEKEKKRPLPPEPQKISDEEKTIEQ